MAKANKEATNTSKRITNIKDWVIAINDSIPLVKKYEQKLFEFYKDTDEPKRYDNSMMTSCYKKKKFSSSIMRVIFSKIIVKIVIVALIVLGFIGSNIGHNHDSLSSIKDNASHYLVSGLSVGLFAFVLISAIHIGIASLKYKSKVQILDKLEAQLKPLMITIPAAYRNSDKMDAIAKIYFTKPSINPSIILKCVDDFLQEVQCTSRFMSVMFDLPTSCPFLGVADAENENMAISIDENGNIEKKNQFLPEDIDTKVVAGSTDADKDLAAMIGLSDVKDQIEHLKNRISFYGKESANTGNHMAFLGSAGTGKTTVARIVTKIMYDLGYIKKNQYIEISGDYLCAGSTSRASAIIEYSYGGVLFIDEAYLMYKNGSEVIGVLLKAMEDHRQDFICILAGYEEQMTKLFASNEGFSSRVKHTIYFSDYTEEEMLDIFNYFIKNYNNKSYKLANEAIPMLMNAFKLEKKAKSFGNARTVRNAVDTIMDFYADRSIAEKSDTRIITINDVENYYEKRKKVLQHEIKNASAANQIDEQIIRLSELKPRVKAGSDDPDGDLASLVGLESFSTEINSLKNQKEFYEDLERQRILLLGDSGCGKSTLARILTGYLYKLGFIEENRYLEIPAEFLKGSFVGHTAKRAESIIAYSSGGVLFIKNYNLLCNSDDAFAGEALSALHTALSDNPNVTIIIADKPSENIENIKSLFTMIYEFPEYTEEQMISIFDNLVEKDGFTIDPDARQKIFDHIVKNHPNIREIQQVWSATKKSHIAKFNGNEQNKYFITPDEVIITKKLKINIKR